MVRWNIFNHQTNVDVDNRFTVYGIRDLGTELSPITNACNDGEHTEPHHCKRQEGHCNMALY